MNLEAFLSEAVAAGEMESRGAFTASLALMVERLSSRLVVDRSLAPLVVVASAVGAGAGGVEILSAKRQLSFRLAMEEPPLPEGQDWRAAFEGGSARHMLLGASVWLEHAASVSLLFPNQGRELRLSREGVTFEPSSRSPHPVELVVRGQVPDASALEVVLLRHGSLSSIPITLDGRAMQADLQAVYGAHGLWSAAVPDHLRPSGDPSLPTDLGLILAPTRRAKPRWVAVVGGISYPFLLPELPGVQGIVWSQDLHTDLSLSGVVWDEAWLRVREQLLVQGRLAGFSSERVCPRCAAETGRAGQIGCPALSERLAGRVLRPEDAGYEPELAGFNTAYRHRPGLVVVARDASDVVETVRFARQHRLRIAIQATGHGVHAAIASDIVVSTRALDHLEVDVASETVRVGAGVTWQAVARAAGPHGLVPVAGSSAGVGVIGYLLGGGLGPLARSHGFSSDYLVEMTVVTGEGRVVRASVEENPDLFWALRGGKCGLGVVLEARVRLVRLPELYAGAIPLPRDSDLGSVLGRWLGWTSSVPEQMTSSFAHSQTGAAIRYAYTGSVSEAKILVGSKQPEKAAPELLLRLHDDPTEPSAFWVSGLLLDHLDEDFVAVLLRQLKLRPTLWAFELRHLGGATARDVPEGSAVGGRAARFAAAFVWSPQLDLFEQDHPRSERELRQALQPWLAEVGNINFAARIRDRAHFEGCWPEEIRARLDEVRLRYDPEGLFCLARPNTRGPES